ncbi:hypothetical protein HETIRDRAFT_105261 [Heterobasidion irregulare TC 32-1]|uniref:Uncharacterized protein n=1 Tax=Heterobasidion irregulare (strain TC 32-1) TaxID=747525 RepID=W4K4E8_HETIT|nr:uncharacterized protein HETIRDRAFT_105261 [Heterobasidion irregulare TC 32-1]ETW80220.1 hypothetical protein HETIRDRAFT_105261 [Heterobasidion irregulare TC 32-1]
MKEAIDIMTRQEVLVQQIFRFRFTKRCFEQVILRWEMNTAPELPKEVHFSCALQFVLTLTLTHRRAHSLSQPLELRRQGAEEESYFNMDDDGSLPLSSTPLLTRH